MSQTKKTTENGFLSLFCIFQRQQTGEGKKKNLGEKKKKEYFYSGNWAGWMFAVSRTPQCTVQSFVLPRAQGCRFLVSAHRCGNVQRCSCPTLLPKHLFRNASRSQLRSSQVGDGSGLLIYRGVMHGVGFFFAIG